MTSDDTKTVMDEADARAIALMLDKLEDHDVTAISQVHDFRRGEPDGIFRFATGCRQPAPAQRRPTMEGSRPRAAQEQ